MAVATPCLQFPHSPTTTKNLNLSDGVLFFRSTFLGTTSCSMLYRTRSYELLSKHRRNPSTRRVYSGSFDNSLSFENEEFSKKIEELGFNFQISSQTNFSLSDEEEEIKEVDIESSLMEIQSIEMKAKSLDLPLSLRMIKRKKKQWQESFMEAKESAYSSIKIAFSSMVFIIRELHCYTLQMREILFYEDLQGILARVQTEMHTSFVWLFQQVFSRTPTLMVYIMILLANFTVHSMSNSSAIAMSQPPIATMEVREVHSHKSFKSDTSSNKFTITKSSSSKTTSVGGNNGGSNNIKPVGSGMDGDGWMNKNSGILHRPIVSDGPSLTGEDTRRKEEEEVNVWNSIVEEASRLQSEVRDEALDGETLQRFVSPLTVKIEEDVDYEDYYKTQLLYQNGLNQEPDNVLLLVNYAQFLYLVVHDFDRAEEYFKRAVKVEPKDAEAHNKYANFLWQVRNDLWAAEETFLEAISAEPSNSYYAANYAHFLWNTGGEDTCFPLDSPDNETFDD
ncbi:uncharacterized protein LOC130826856 [Amaranthus tricolor]|uniref:uncharacterized protein LOC130826856 n=1 Tax=Amaranthus tricolor TaxID=29722 RepID=UPI00258CBA7F|nr:uncharacterized protein LOC130826856 [Amaranthus tricolor]XP_057548439.1 uncharacterized protein LOC130826856 [Amaranthus tricolor]